MENDKRKRSKIPCLFGGNGDNLNRKAVQPRSPSDGFTDQKKFEFEVGQMSSKQAYGTPMKTLLAKEMLNETLAKKRSPSLIAKLMGLDGLPSPQPINRQPRKLSDNSQKSTPKRIEKPFSYQLDKKTTKEQQHFKDVYEDPEASHVGNQLYSPPSIARRSTKLEFGYINDRCDEMLRESTAIKSKLERVDSNSDLMLSFLQRDQQDVPFVSLCNQITVLKPSNAVRHGSHGKGLKEEKDTVKYHVPVSRRRNDNGHSGYSCHSNNNCRRSSRYQLERQDANVLSPTRIVVLKPNVAKIYNDKVYLPPDESELFMYDGPPCEVRSSKHKSTEAREIARKITSQMKEGFESGHFDLFDSGFREYASASASESDMMAVPSRNSFNRSDRPRRSPSNMSESAVIREAKKRMSQRWKTHGYKDVGVVGKGSTLEEMLSVPNCEARHGKIGCVASPVNEEYGWSDGYLRRTSRSRSLPPSSHNRSHRTSNYHEARADEKIMVPNEPLQRGQSKRMKGKSSHPEDLRSKNIRYSKRCQSSQHCSPCSPDFDDILPMETYFEKNDSAEQVLPISDDHDATANAATVIDVIRVSSGFPNELNLCIPRDADSSAVDDYSSNSQESLTANSQGTASIHLSGPEPESSEGSKEFDQHGLTSALEVPSTEDVSSGSDCFERVGSQLNELRKQLHLLKMLSGSTYDSPDEEDIERSSSFAVSESENWESTYLTDLLQNSGLYDHDPYTFMATWYSVDSPIDQCLFDHLEKKYGHDTTISKSERCLFHDRVNEALFVLFKTMVSCSWVNPGQRGIQMTLTEIGFEDQLQKLLAKQEKEANDEYEDISIDKDLDWFQAVSEIDVVGKQIAEVLVNELVLEIVSGY